MKRYIRQTTTYIILLGIVLFTCYWLLEPEESLFVLRIVIWSVATCLGGGTIIAMLAGGTLGLLWAIRTGHSLWINIAEEHIALAAKRREAEVKIITSKSDEAVYVLSHGKEQPEVDPIHYRLPAHAPQTPSSRNQWNTFHTRNTHPLLPEPAAWPAVITLADLMDERPSLNKIIVGMTVSPQGQQILTYPLYEMVHTGIGGTSGWGKSMFMRSIAIQILCAPEPTDVYFADLEGVTFNQMASHYKVRMPVASEIKEVRVMTKQLKDEMTLRKELYQEYDRLGIQTINEYNEIASDPLPLIVFLMDEAATIMSKDSVVHDHIVEIATRARKYGIYVICGANSWKAKRVDTDVTNNFSTKIHFKATTPHQSRVLLGTTVAHQLSVKGRAWGILPGLDMLEFQAPLVSRAMIDELLKLSNQMHISGTVPQSVPYSVPTVPIIESVTDPESSNRELVIRLASQGCTVSTIAREVYGTDGGKQIQLVRKYIREKLDETKGRT